MKGNTNRWRISRLMSVILCSILFTSIFASAKTTRRSIFEEQQLSSTHMELEKSSGSWIGWRLKDSGYQHVWPELKFGWEVVVGSVIGFFGAAFGSVGGVSGGGIFIPMLTLIIGFDAKSATALSKFTSTKTFFKGVETWKKENLMKEEAKKKATGTQEAEYKLLPGGPSNETENKNLKNMEVTILENIRWKEFGLLFSVWLAYLAVQITQNYIPTCSTAYWVVNSLQIPVSFGLCLYEAISLYKGTRVIASKGNAHKNLKLDQLLLYCFCGLLAGTVGGLLGIGGGFIMGFESLCNYDP